MVLQPHEIILASAVALLFVGPCLGSFASAVAYRVPRGLSWISDNRGKAGASRATRSECPHCGYQLRFLDLIPILSWLFLRGRCRHCHAPVSALYPLLEILAAVSAEAFLFLRGPEWALLPLLMMLPFILAQMVIIWQAPGGREVVSLSPQLLSLISVFTILFVLTTEGLWLWHLAGAVLMFFVATILLMARKLRGAKHAKTDAIRLVWLFALIGGLLGVKLVPVFLITAGIIGMLVAIVRAARKAPVRDGLMLGVMPAFLLILAAGPQIMALLIL